MRGQDARGWRPLRGIPAPRHAVTTFAGHVLILPVRRAEGIPAPLGGPLAATTKKGNPSLPCPSQRAQLSWRRMAPETAPTSKAHPASGDMCGVGRDPGMVGGLPGDFYGFDKKLEKPQCDTASRHLLTPCMHMSLRGSRLRGFRPPVHGASAF